MSGRAWCRHVARAVCVDCGWRRDSRGVKRAEFVARYARRHAEAWGHEVEVGFEKYVLYRPPARMAGPRQRREEA